MYKKTETPIRLLIRKHLNEMAIIKPYDFSHYIDELKKSEREISNLNDINKLFKGSEIYFSDFDTYFNALTNEKEKIVAPKELMLMGGVKFALYNTNIDKINVVVEPFLFFDFINSRQNKQQFYEFLHLVLRHESIHLQQVSKMGKDKYVLDASPTVNTKKYWTSPYEIMAYAQSLVDDLQNQGNSKEEIEDFFRDPESMEKVGSWIYDLHKKVLNKKQFEKFRKYAYLYLN